MQTRIHILVILLFFCTVSGQAQETREINGQRFEFYSVQSGARRLFIDSRGFMWIGSRNGVVRFDGYNSYYTKENPLDSDGFKGIYVNAIVEDHNGGIWVATDQGLNYSAAGNNTFMHIPFVSDPVYSMIVDKDNKIWLTQGKKIIIFSPQSHHSSLPETETIDLTDDVFIWKLLLTAEAKVLGFGSGVYDLKNLENGGASVKPIIEKNNFLDITQADDGSIYILADSLFYILDAELTIIDQKELNIHTSRASLHIDRKGVFWVGIDWGFIRAEIDKDYNIQSTDFYKSGGIRDIIEDASGNIFFADRNGGIYKLGWNHKQYEYISLPPEYEDTYTFNFIEDKDGNYWIGTTKGLLYYDVGMQSYRDLNPDQDKATFISEHTIYSLLKDRDENIWIATGGGVARFDMLTKRFTSINIKGLAHHIIESRDGTIWLVANEILYSVEPVNLSVSSFKNIQGERTQISQIYIDSENIMWSYLPGLGTVKYSIENGTPQFLGTILSTKQYGRVNSNWMVEDDLGRLWISKSIGVYVVDKKSGELIKFFNTSNSILQQDDVFEMIKDRRGNIWLKQHAHGSISIDPSNFEVERFNPSWLYSPSSQTYTCVVAVGSDGKLFTDGNSEFCVFYPDSVKINTVPPTIALEELKVNDRPTQDIELKLKHFENNLNFKFTGLHFDNPKRNRYEFYLEGFDKDWVQSEYYHEALYSALPPGSYSFFVKACNSDGIWSGPALLSTIRIMRPWFGSILAFIMYILILASIIFTIYQMQLRRKIALTEVKKLNEIDEFKNKFFTNISHEFRTPLTVISGMAENIKGKQGALIRRNSDQILTLVSQILELSKIEANAVEVKNEQLDIIAKSRYLLYSFSSLADDKAIDVQFTSDLDSLMVMLDPDKYTMILQNLISNAIKFTPEIGKIILEINKNKGRFELIVADTGAGISADDLPNIFNRYFQADNQQAEYQGTGIGLALTRQLVELMNGKIDVSSTPGQGTRFIVNLPVGIVEAELLAPEQKDQGIIDQDPGEEKTHILLVEDNMDVCIVIRDLLKANYEVYTADNGMKGLNMALNNVPDIIISDVMMPEMDGLELTQNLKKDKRTSHIPVILLTAKADINSRLEGLSFGAEAYLQKPFNNKELLLNVQNLLQLREAMRARYGDEELSAIDSNNPEDQFIVSLNELILQNLSDDSYGIMEICKDVGVSRTQLHRKLTALTGRSISIYVRDIRLAEGRKLIRKKEGTIAEIAYSTGFKDPNYFSRLYAEKYGYPPTQEKIQPS